MFWKWQCLKCSRTFVKKAGFIITLKCRYCGDEELGFSKIAEQNTKYE